MLMNFGCPHVFVYSLRSTVVYRLSLTYEMPHQVISGGLSRSEEYKENVARRNSI